MTEHGNDAPSPRHCGLAGRHLPHMWAAGWTSTHGPAPWTQCPGSRSLADRIRRAIRGAVREIGGPRR